MQEEYNVGENRFGKKHNIRQTCVWKKYDIGYEDIKTDRLTKQKDK